MNETHFKNALIFSSKSLNKKKRVMSDEEQLKVLLIRFIISSLSTMHRNCAFSKIRKERENI